MKVFVSEPMEAEALKFLKTFAEVITPEEDEWVDKCDVVYRKLKPMVTDSTQCDYVACPCTNIAHLRLKDVTPIYLDEHWRKGVGRNTTGTAEMAWTMYMALMRKLIPANAHTEAGGFDRELFRGHQLNGKTAGIIGYGRVGKLISRYARTFGMKFIIHDPAYIVSYPLNEVLEKSDVVFVCCTSDKSTDGLIGYEQFQMMHKETFIINVSRSQIIDEHALCSALALKKIAGAGLDVTESYNLSVKRMLQIAQRQGRAIVTPHISGNTSESRLSTDMYLVHQIKKIHDSRKAGTKEEV